MRSIIAILLLLAPLGALAQEEEEAAPLSTTSTDDKKAEKINQVEHGFFLGVETGLLLAKPGGNQLNATGTSLATGQSVGVEIGFEPLPLLSFGLIIVGTSVGTPATYIGTQDPSSSSLVSGNVSTLMIGGNARLNISLGEDVNGLRRTFFYIRAGAGYSLVFPKSIGSNELMVFGGPGIEYFTRLRHFSLGFEVLPGYGLSNKGFSVVAQPVVRYNF